MGSVAFNGIDQIGDQVVTALELVFDLRPFAVDVLIHGNKAVVAAHNNAGENNNDGDNNH